MVARRGGAEGVSVERAVGQSGQSVRRVLLQDEAGGLGLAQTMLGRAEAANSRAYGTARGRGY